MLRSSRIYETAPVGPPQPDFLNAVIGITASVPPRDVLTACLSVERMMGRDRSERWGPRGIDIDLLVYGDAQVSEPDLQLPHPRMHVRAFVLIPLLELEPHLVLPGGRPIAAMRMQADSVQGVRLFAPALSVPDR